MKYYKTLLPHVRIEDKIFTEKELSMRDSAGLIMDEVPETDWVQQEIEAGRLTNLPEYWCVKNDMSDLFKQTVSRYLNDKYKMGCKGTISDFYGSEEECLCTYKENFQNNPIELTVKQFIRLSKLWGEIDTIKESLKREKPPIGLKPKEIFKSDMNVERFNEVCNAIVRYCDAGSPINISWIEEYNEFAKDKDFIINKISL